MGEEYEKKDLGTQGDENTLKGKLKQATGKVQETAGKMTGNTEGETEGKAKQVEGTGQSTVGNAERKIDDTFNRKTP